MANCPLALCEDFPAIARRYEAWWAQDVIDRPVFIGTANTNPDRPINRRLDVIEQPERWFEAKYADMAQSHRAGDALPYIRADFGPVLLGAAKSVHVLTSTSTVRKQASFLLHKTTLARPRLLPST